MLVGIKNTLDWFTETGFAHWVLYYKGAEKGGQPVFRFDEEDEQTQTDAMDRLRKALSMLDRGSYSLMALTKPKASGRGAQKIHFEISTNHAPETIQMHAPVVQGISQDEVKSQIAAALSAYKIEVELDVLRKENAALKKQVAENEKSDPLNAIIGHLGPYMPELLGITKPGISGLPVPAPKQYAPMPEEISGGTAFAGSPVIASHSEATTGPEITDEQHERLSNVVSVFVAASPDEWLTILEKMAAKVQSTPSILNTIKMFL